MFTSYNLLYRIKQNLRDFYEGLMNERTEK